MPKYVIERTIHGAGKLSESDLCKIAEKSNGVLSEMGSNIQWLHSYVTDDKIYCVYVADSEDTIRRHAQIGGFPLDSITKVVRVIDPTTAEYRPALIGA